MFKRRTLFVLGAGASKELNLPTGDKLAFTISQKMDISVKAFRNGQTNTQGDLELFAEFAQSSDDPIQAYQDAFWLIRDGVLTQSSIDDFLDIHKDNPLAQRVGKAAIVKNILLAERNSLLYFDPSNAYNKMKMVKLENTWLLKFMRVLGRGVPLKDIEYLFDNVAFIVFNYDRCLEFFLIHALKSAYNLSEPDATELMGKLTIIHPYGVAGTLRTTSNPSGVAFGGGEKPHDTHVPLIDQIKTYTEQVDDPDELEAIWGRVVWADQIVFLGFAFHDQNVRLLRPDGRLKAKNIFGTTYGMSDSDVNIIKGQLIHFFDESQLRIMRDMNRIVLRSDLKCSQLFEQYTKSLPG
jgi:hypothetical protein